MERKKIAIIGAGPAGLAMAEALKKKGYSEITIFEKTNRVGGQSYSEKYITPDQKEIIYELGSIQPISSKRMFELMKQYQVHSGKLPFSKGLKSIVYSLKEKKVLIDFKKYLTGYPLRDFPAFFLDQLKLLYYLYRYRAIMKPGFTHLKPHLKKELIVPFEEWIDSKRFKLIGNGLKLGVGHILLFANPKLRSKKTALSFFKLLQQFMHFPPRFIDGTIKQMHQGYQELWCRVAKHHQIIYHAEIQSIQRSEQDIKIQTKTAHYEFDYLIIACTPKEIINVLENSEKEHQLFSRIQFCPGWRAAFTAKNLPNDRVIVFSDAYFADQPTGLMMGFWPEGQVDKETWLYGTGFSHPEPDHIDQVILKAENVLQEHFSAKDIKWIKTVFWPNYAAHFPIDELENNIYEKIEELQGQKSTYWIGQTMSGGSHPIVVDYAFDLAERFF